MLGMLLQRFEFVDFANYQLETKQTLTIKPDEFHIKVQAARAGARRPRRRRRPRPAAAPAASAPSPAAAPIRHGVGAHHTPLLVLFGSNLGTAEGLAHASPRTRRTAGFAATVGALDEHVGALPKEGAVVIVTASYNGQPPDNAAKFCQWLRDPALPAEPSPASSTASSAAAIATGRRPTRRSRR